MSKNRHDRADKPSFLRRWSKRLALLTLGLLVFAVLLEVLVTLALGTQVRFPRHVVDGGFGVRINEPNTSYRHTSPDVSVAFSINAQGMRAMRDYPYAKPAGVKRIVSLGDSFTIGYEVEFEECFSSVFEAELRARGYEVEVLNAGVSGYSNAEALLYLERELLKYEPDLVLLNFFNNDLIDNVRSNLFTLEDGKLVAKNESYIPLGRTGNFLNTNPVFNFLSERSNAFALIKERITLALKRRNVQENQGAPEEGYSEGGGELLKRQQALAAAILDRMAEVTRAEGIPLLIQNIPLVKRKSETELELLDVFPHEAFAAYGAEREGVEVLNAKDFLQPHVGKESLYHRRSHAHWTPFASGLAGKALADIVIEKNLLD